MTIDRPTHIATTVATNRHAAAGLLNAIATTLPALAIP